MRSGCRSRCCRIPRRIAARWCCRRPSRFGVLRHCNCVCSGSPRSARPPADFVRLSIPRRHAVGRHAGPGRSQCGRMVFVTDARPTEPTGRQSADPDHPQELRRIAERIVTEAAEHLRGLPRPWDDAGAGPAGGVATKSTPTDVVTESDHALETLVRERLAQLRPGDSVVGEEHGGSAGGSRTLWVVDPIDGTVNFLYGLPWYAVSLAAVRDGESVAGAVAEPATGRLWSAAVGAGATCDGRPLRVSGATRPVAVAARHRLLLPRRAAGPAGRDGRRDAAGGAGRAAHRLGRAGPVRGGRRLARRVPGARVQLVGLGRRRAHRHRGRGRRAHAGAHRQRAARRRARRRRAPRGDARDRRRPAWRWPGSTAPRTCEPRRGRQQAGARAPPAAAPGRRQAERVRSGRRPRWGRRWPRRRCCRRRGGPARRGRRAGRGRG